MKRFLVLPIVLSACCVPTSQENRPVRTQNDSHQANAPTEATPLDADDRVAPNGQSAADTEAIHSRFAAPPEGTAYREEGQQWRPVPSEKPTARWESKGPTQKTSPRNWGITGDAPSAAEVNRDVAAPAVSSGATSKGYDHGVSRSPKPTSQRTKDSLRKSAVSKSAREGSSALGQLGDTRRREAENRPGLATTWGETRYSAVSEVPFQRDSARPFYTATMNYNDPRGAASMTSGHYRGGSASVGLGKALTLSLRDENGNTFSAYRGNGKTVAVGQNGQRYTLVVKNNTNERFEIVLSVDGLDVIDGRPASFRKRGYLVAPYGVVEIDGFRQSADQVAAFRFGSVANSYAAKTGSARNVGVVGAAAFGERGYAARLQAYRERMYALRMQGVEIQRRRQADPFPRGYALPPLELAQ